MELDVWIHVILQYDTMPLLFRAQQFWIFFLVEAILGFDLAMFWDSDKKATAHNPKADRGKYRQWAV